MAKEENRNDLISEDDRAILRNAYGKGVNNELSEEQINRMVADYGDKDSREAMNPRIAQVLAKYDTNNDGQLDFGQQRALKDHLQLGDTTARYAAYTGVLARSFRYLAFTSDFGEALRPVVKASIVRASYGVSLGYCVADVAWEAHKLRQHNYHTDAGEPMTMAQCVVERASFQAVASVAMPFAIIHTAVSASRKIFSRLRGGRFSKWGPSVVGLACIPLLPMYVDEPVEEAIEFAFQRYGPWASPEVQSQHKAHPHQHSHPHPLAETTKPPSDKSK